MKISAALYWLFAVIVFLLVLGYYTPRPFSISYHWACTEKGCQMEADDQKVILNTLQQQVDQNERLDEFSKPFSGFMRFIPKTTNQSTAELTVENPKQAVTQQIPVVCILPGATGLNTFSYGAGIIINQTTSLSNIPEVLKTMVTPLLSNCFPQPEFSNLNMKVAANSEVRINANVKYLIEFEPDPMSKIMSLFLVLLSFFTLLPVLKQGARFSSEGMNYFSKELV